MMSIDQGKAVIFVLLDTSVVFDTVDHNICFSSLKDMLGLSSKVLEWFRSYLEQSSQRVSVRGILSYGQFFVIWCTIRFGSWSSGFRLFWIIMHRYGVKYHVYADETRLHKIISLHLDNKLNLFDYG